MYNIAPACEGYVASGMVWYRLCEYWWAQEEWLSLIFETIMLGRNSSVLSMKPFSWVRMAQCSYLCDYYAW
jgi:hypothetical protein